MTAVVPLFPLRHHPRSGNVEWTPAIVLTCSANTYVVSVRDDAGPSRHIGLPITISAVAPTRRCGPLSTCFLVSNKTFILLLSCNHLLTLSLS